jgi:heme exporter protein D
MRLEAMNHAEALRRAMAELGDESAEELAAFVRKAYGVTVRPQFVPVLKATLQDKEMLAEWRRKAMEARPDAPVSGKEQQAAEEASSAK